MSKRTFCLAVLMSLLVTSAGPSAWAQDSPGSRSRSSSTAFKRPLEHADYDLWNRVGSSRISSDGAWVLYSIDSADSDLNSTLHIRSVESDQRFRITQGQSAAFSYDSRHVVYLIKPDKKVMKEAQKKARKQKDGPQELPKDVLEIRDLSNGKTVRIERVRSFSMPRRGGRWLAYLMEKPPETKADKGGDQAKKEESEEAKQATQSPSAGKQQEEQSAEEKKEEKKEKKKDVGSQLVVRDLHKGAEYRFQNVLSYSFSENGKRLVYTASAEEADGDGVFVVKPGSSKARQVISGRGNYKSLVLDKAGRQLAFLTNRDDYEAKQPAWKLFHWGGSGEAKAVAGPDTKGIPEGWWIADSRSPSFSESGKRLMFGTRPQPESEDEKEDGDDDEKEEEDEPEVKVDVWHWKDPLLQPMQLVRAASERNRSYLALAHLSESDRVVQLATPEVPDVTVGQQGDADVAIGRSNLPYQARISWDSPGYNDVFLIQVGSGKSQLVVKELQGSASLSPAGRFIYWWDGAQLAWMAMPVDSRKPENLTELLPRPVHNELHDSPRVASPYGIAGWLEDDKGILIYDRNDIWLTDPAGFFPPSCITDEAGRELGLRFQYTQLDREERAIKPDQTLMLSATHLRDKSTGYYLDKVRGNDKPKKLIMQDEVIRLSTKADSADKLLLTRQTFQNYPDLWVGGIDFQNLQRMSEANPQQSEFLWGTAELVEWASSHGEQLQGILYKPEGFNPARKYPMMVYFYERSSSRLHRYMAPAPGSSSINISFYVSRGYVVFVPDIPYQIGRPGQSAMSAVIPGVLHVLSQGFVDEKRVGVQGHSWGGYQIAYMVTKTNLFAAAEAGAPVSNMTSAYGGIRWSSGMSRMFQYEKTQSRIGGTLWDSQQKYIENSPVFWADSVETPLLMLHNDEDGAVPWYQGIEMFVALRRLSKPVWMLNYNGEAHGLRQAQNRRDFAVRMQQFFDHYLKDAPAPVWLAEGVPALQKGKTLGLELAGGVSPDLHERHAARKRERDATFKKLSAGVMTVKKVAYPSRVDQMSIPAYVFQPLKPRGEKGHAALVWIHGGVHGDLDAEHYFPFLKEAVERGYVVVCPEYRGSTGYGKEHYDAIDYGGYEVDDCLSAIDYIREELPHVDPERLGIIGWSHGGFITLHSVFRDQESFRCAASLVPVTNLIFRLSYKGPGYQRAFATQERIGGLPHQRRKIYVERSPVYHVDKLKTPLLVHLADNDRDVDFVEAEMLVNALLVKKPDLVETKIYNDPEGGHSFNRRVKYKDDYSRDDTPDQIDSWNRIWKFLDRHLRPAKGK